MIGVIKGTMRQKKEVNGLPLPIASYKAHLKAPIRSFKVAITAKQSGSGTPAPDNIRPISGWSECNVCNTPMPVSQLWTIDSSFNGVVNFNQLIQTKAAQTYQVSGLTITFDGNGKVKVENTASASVNIPITSNYPTYIEGHKYFIKGCPSGGSNSTYSLRYNSNGFGENGNGSILTAVTSGAANRNILVGSDYPAISIANGTSVNKTFEPIIIDLTQKFGSTIADYIYSLEQGTAGAGVAFFRSIYPNDYYAYDTGTDEMVGSREGNTYTIQLSDTYYGGSLDVTTGVLTITHTYIKGGFTQYASGNGYKAYRKDNLPKSKAQSTGGISNMISEFGSFSSSAMTKNIISLPISTTLYMALDENYNANDVEVCYELATPITVQLTPTQIEQLLGMNNVFADTGDVEELEYTDRQVYYGR